MAIHARNDFDDPAALDELAWLYAKTNRPKEALQTIDYTRKATRPQSVQGRLYLTEGDAHQQLNQLNEASAAFNQAMKYSQTKKQADLRLAMLQVRQGRCPQPIPALRRAMTTPPVPGSSLASKEEIQLALARCLLDSGSYEAAIEEARRLSTTTDDSLLFKQASYLISVAAYRGGGSELPPDLKAESELWEELISEERAATAFAQQLKAATTR